MLVITPDALYGRVGAVLSALIVITCLIGLTLHSEVFSCVPRRDFFWYYTNLSNLLVLFYFVFAAPFFYARHALSAFIPLAEFSVTASIMLTNAVFHLMIFPGVKPQMKSILHGGETRMLAANNLMVHYAVPWLVFFYYILCSPMKHMLPLYLAPLWLIFPLLYALAVFLRAQSRRSIPGTDRLYPYPFLDITLLGKQKVMLTCAFLLVICALGSIAAACIIRGIYAFFGGNRALMLVG